MQFFKIFILYGLAMLSFEADAQIANGDFTNGTSSWTWSQSYALSSGTCPNLQTFVPSQSADTPFLHLNQNYGRSAKVTWAQPTSSLYAVYCRKIEQEVFVPIGSRVLLDFWSNQGRNASGTIDYSSANLEITLKDVVSGLTRTYPVNPADGQSCTEITGTGCSDYFNSTIDIDSAFWGKRVKFSINTKTFKWNSDFTVPATAYVDNVRLEKEGVGNFQIKSGAWYNPYRSGHGFHISRTSDNRFQLIWYTYLSNGKPIWYISDVAPMINGVITAKIYKSTWNYSTQTNSSVIAGDIKLEANNNNHFTFFWDLNSVNGDNVDYDGGEPMFHLLGQGSYTGLWYEPALSGYGYSIDHRNSDNYTATTVFYYINGEPVWARGEKASAPIANSITSLVSIKGMGLCPECNGQSVSKTTSPVGEVGFSLDANKSWVYVQDAAGVPVWQRGLPQQPVDTYRLTFP